MHFQPRCAGLAAAILILTAACGDDLRMNGDSGSLDGATDTAVGDGDVDSGNADATPTDGGADAAPTDGSADAAPSDGGTDAAPADGGTDAGPEGCTWEIETVAPATPGLDASSFTEGEAAWTSIAASSGRVDIAFHDPGMEAVRYATNASGSWVVETVDSGDEAGADGVAIVVGPAGEVDIAYTALPSANEIRVATRTGTSWTMTTVREAGYRQTVRDLSMARASDGRLMLVATVWRWLDSIVNYLELHERSGGAWSRTEQWTTRDNLGVDLALDDRDQIHIAYAAVSADFSPSQYRLHVMSNASGEWTGRVFGGHCLSMPSVDADALRNTYASCRDPDFDDLRLWDNTTGAWETQIADDVGDVGNYSSLAVAPDGTAHLTHQTQIRNNLLYTTDESGAWVTETVDDDGSTGRYTDVALVGSDLHVSYMRSLPEGQVRYARRRCR